ncbi:MAG: hypothetical protein V1835_02670 [Candidatus Micrarchaeota archaeon]
MRPLSLLILLLFFFLFGCFAFGPPAPSPSPLPEVHINPPEYSQLNKTFTECLKYTCRANVSKPILAVAENRINKTTYDRRMIPLDIPECPITDVWFDRTQLMEERVFVSLPDQMDYYVLHYLVPLKAGTFSVRFKNSCQMRGDVYTIIAK